MTPRPVGLTAKLKKRVAAATVRVTAKSGQGVLVPGGFVLTASHCVKWNGEGGMVLGDVLRERIQTAGGKRMTLRLVAAEPVADIAVLGELHSNVLSADDEAFIDWQYATQPVPVVDLILGVGDSSPVHILTHKGTWVDGVARCYESGLPTISMEMDGLIKGGTSGGPVVNDAGELVGIVSNSTERAEHPQCFNPILHLALPCWVSRAIMQAQSKLAP